MERFAGTVQKRIGLLISIIGIFVVISNYINSYIKDGHITALSNHAVWLLLLLVVPFILSVFKEHRLFKYYQITAFIITGALNVIEAYEQFYGPGLFLAGWLLLRQYGFLDKHKIPKNIIIISVLVVLSQVSAFLHTDEGVYAGFSTLWYALFLSSLVLIIWRDMITQQEELKKENRDLKTNYRELSARLDEIEESKKPYDLKSHKVTPAEERVIKTLTVYKASNREIAERLDIKENTVKLHIYNICNKLGVDSRFAIIDLCKYNF